MRQLAPAGHSITVYHRTPAMAERLANLPPSSMPVNTDPKLNFDQDIAYDTSRIRKELGYRELMPEEEAMESALNPES